jgi:hypothetical protein
MARRFLRCAVVVALSCRSALAFKGCPIRWDGFQPTRGCVPGFHAVPTPKGDGYHCAPNGIQY